MLAQAAQARASSVALRKESVDRNAKQPLWLSRWGQVALRKESVDRNTLSIIILGLRQVSLSARRAWIEIAHHGRLWRIRPVALRKESVDRNFNIPPRPNMAGCRSPQGERG